MEIKTKRKIGEFFTIHNILTSPQVEQILQLQKHHLDEKFGEIALMLHFLNDDAINLYIKYINNYFLNEQI